MASNENLSPQNIRRVLKEVQDLSTTPPEGIKLLVNEEDVTQIQAVIEGPAGTPYDGGFFKIKLILGPDFPNSPPKGFFLTKIFHPNVGPKGEICVNTLKKDWKSELGIKHVLLTIKCLLIVPNPESALNEEAGKLLLEAYDEYAKHAKLMTSIHAKKPPSPKKTKDAPSASTTNNATTTTTTAKSTTSGTKKKVDAKKGLKRL